MTAGSPPARLVRDTPPPFGAGPAATDATEGKTEGKTPGAAAERGPADAPQARRGRLLIIDDEVVFSGSLRRLFSNEHDVTVVNRGREALDQLRGGRRYDAILCDLVMPEVSGIDLYCELQQIAPDQAACMIFLTGGSFSEKSQGFLDGIGNRCFEKPCNLEQLKAAIREVVVRNGSR
jgi:CheY-like chemotaxis protein